MGHNEIEVTLNDSGYRLIRYGEETIDGADVFSRPCHVCGARPSTRHLPTCELGRGAVHERPSECRDCGVAIAEHHLGGCGIEQCPRCGGQYVSCECDSSEDRDEDEPG